MIALRDVRFGYARGTTAFACDTLDVGPGVTLLLGPNGAGKSTLLKLMSGVEQPTAGSVCVDGHDLWRDEVAARAALAVRAGAPGSHAIRNGRRSARARVSSSRPSGRRRRPCAADRRPRGVSGADRCASFPWDNDGEPCWRPRSSASRRRCCSMSHSRRWISAMRLWLTSWITNASARNATVVVATHDVEPFVSLARRAIVVSGGAPSVLESAA